MAIILLRVSHPCGHAAPPLQAPIRRKRATPTTVFAFDGTKWYQAGGASRVALGDRHTSIRARQFRELVSLPCDLWQGNLEKRGWFSPGERANSIFLGHGRRPLRDDHLAPTALGSTERSDGATRAPWPTQKRIRPPDRRAAFARARPGSRVPSATAPPQSTWPHPRHSVPTRLPAPRHYLNPRFRIKAARLQPMSAKMILPI
jgi:hypothetical protein